MPDDTPKPNGLGGLLAPFLAPDATLTFEGALARVSLPDGRSFTFGMDGFSYGNPNAEPLPPFDFRDRLGKGKP